MTDYKESEQMILNYMQRSIKLYDIINGRVWFEGKKCRFDDFKVNEGCSYYSFYLVYYKKKEERFCKLFNVELNKKNRCQNCIDIFGK